MVQRKRRLFLISSIILSMLATFSIADALEGDRSTASIDTDLFFRSAFATSEEVCALAKSSIPLVGVLSAEVNEKKKGALHVAAANGQTELVERLLAQDESRFQVNLPDIEGNTPLHLAARYGHVDIVKLLVRYSVTRLYRVRPSSHVHIIGAAWSGPYTRCETYRCNTSLKNREGHTALDLANIYQHREVAEVLSPQACCSVM